MNTAIRRMAPLLKLADELGAHLFIHPGHLVPAPLAATDSDNAWMRKIVLATQHQLSAAMMTLCSTAILDPYPHLTIHVANLGGAFPFYLERLRAVASDDPDGSAWFFDPGRLRVDSASFGAGAIGMALDTLGRDRVLPGTDMPLFEPTRAVLA